MVAPKGHTIRERNLILLPKQLLLYHVIKSSPYTWIGYGGARGGAKSHAIREIAIQLGEEYGVCSLIFRRYRQELLDNHIYPMLEAHPELKDRFNKTEMILFDTKGNPILQFGYADRQEDIYTFQGMSYPLIFIDEATQLTKEMIEWLSTSNRDSKERIVPKMILTFNPGGVGHAYIKRVFIDKMYFDEEKGSQYFFVQSSVWDNVFWVKKKLMEMGYTIDDYYRKWTDEQRRDFTLAYSDYAKRLASLPRELRLAYLFGDWDVFGGQFFKDFNKKTQVIDPFVIPQGWRIIGALDPGWASPCSFSVSAVDFNYNIYRVFSYYETERSAPRHADEIYNLLHNETSPLYKMLNGRQPEIIVSGLDAWSKHDRFAMITSDKTFFDCFAEKGLYLQKAVTDRIPGWWAMKDYMSRTYISPDGKLLPKYYVFDHFNNPFLDELMSAVSDEKKPEDIQGKGKDPDVADHALDEERYKIMSIWKPDMDQADNIPDFWKKKNKKVQKHTVMGV